MKLEKYKDNFINGTELLDSKSKRRVLSISPSLDFALCGGVPDGSLVLVRAPKKVGKTTICMQACANAQKQGRKVVYVDVECRLGKKNFQIEGLDPSLFTIITHAAGKILSGEEMLELVLACMGMPDNQGAVYVIDSFSDICTSSEMESETSGQLRSTTPKLNASFCRKVTGPLNMSGSIMFGIQHMITNTGSMYGGIKADGGVKLEYKADVILETKHQQKPLEGTTFSRESKGQRIEWQIPCTELGPPVMDKDNPVISYITYGKGIDYLREASIILEEVGEIQKGGSWFTVPFLDNQKFQGRDKLTEALEAKRDLVEAKLNSLKKEMFGVEC